MDFINNEILSLLALKKSLSKEKQPLVGLEYLIFLRDCKTLSCNHPYICSLCNKKGELNQMLCHFVSVHHRLKFLSEHFPSCACALDPKDFTDRQEVFVDLLERLCSEIDSRLGRLMPLITTTHAFQDDPEGVHKKIKDGYHRGENPSSTLPIDLIMKITATLQSIEKDKKRKRSTTRHDDEQSNSQKRQRSPSSSKYHRKSPSPSSSSRHRKSRDSMPKIHKSPRNHQKSSPSSSRKHRETSPSPSSSRLHRQLSPILSRSRSHRDRSISSRPNSYVPNSVVDYRRKLEEKVSNINKKYDKTYVKDSNSHPNYIAEWNAFYLRKLNSAQSHGKEELDRAEVTTKWGAFWKSRLVELKEEEILMIRVNLREKMDLPVETADLEKIEKIKRDAKMMINEKNPKVFRSETRSSEKQVKKKAIVDLDELTQEINEKFSKNGNDKKSVNRTRNIAKNNKEDSGVSSNDEAQKTPLGIQKTKQEKPLTEHNMSPVEQHSSPAEQKKTSEKQKLAETHDNMNLDNSDIITLFGMFASLSEGLQHQLTSFMNHLEKSDPERWQLLNSSHVDNYDSKKETSSEKYQEEEEDASIEEVDENCVAALSVESMQLPVPDNMMTTVKTLPIPSLQESSANDEEDDDYDYSDVIKKALKNVENAIVDLPDNDDSELIEVVDLTEDEI